MLYNDKIIKFGQNVMSHFRETVINLSHDKPWYYASGIKIRLAALIYFMVLEL